MSAIELETVVLGSSAGPSKLPPLITVTLKLPVAVWLAASVTIAVKLNVPVVVGVPPKFPLAFIEVPGGTVPAEILQV